MICYKKGILIVLNQNIGIIENNAHYEVETYVI